VVADWSVWLGAEAAARIEFLRRQMKTGRPSGSPAFLASLENLLQRTLASQQHGRKQKQQEANGAPLINS
jgi:hypothetical protein